MKITDLQTVLLTGPSTDDPFLREARQRRSAAFIEVHTDAGVVGIGETYAGYFCPELVPPIVAMFRPILLGQSVENVELLWDRMYNCENFWGRVGLGIAVLNGVEAALWDLKGKLLGVPVYELLGGRKHESIECYATGGPTNYPKDQLARKIDFYLEQGFRGFKLGAGSYSKEHGWFMPNSPSAAAEFEADKLTFVRKHVGRDVSVMLDGHMGNLPTDPWDFDTAAAVVAALAPFDLKFFEEPLHYNDPAGYQELCRRSTIPIAGGECLTGAAEWRMFVDRDCFDIGQPDASFTGGLSECLKVAAMFEARGRKIATHCWGAGGSLMQNLHVAFACRNTAVVEVPPAYGPLHSLVVGDSFRMKDGPALPPAMPGLGIVLDERIKNRFPFVSGSGSFNSVPGRILND